MDKIREALEDVERQFHEGELADEKREGHPVRYAVQSMYLDIKKVREALALLSAPVASDARELVKMIEEDCFDPWRFDKEAKQYRGAFDTEDAIALVERYAAERERKAREEYPVANEKESALGWTFAYDFLCKISDATRASGEYVCMEGVEAVIRALLARERAEPALEEHDLWIDTDALPPEPAEERGPEVDALLWMAEHLMGSSAASTMRGWLAEYRATGKLVVRDADGTVKESLTVGEDRRPEVGDVVYIRWLNGYQEVTTYSALLQAEIRGATVIVLMRRCEVEARIKDKSKEEER